MVRKLFKWISKAGDVAINRLKRQEEQENGCPGTSSRRHMFDHHPMLKKKHQSLPISPRKSQVVDSQTRTFIVDKRRYAVVDPFNIGGHHRSQSVDNTRNFATILSCDFQSQIEPEVSIRNNKPTNANSNQRTRLEDLTEGIEEETPATILVAKKEKLTRHSQLSIQSVRHITGKSISSKYNKLHDKKPDRQNFSIVHVKYPENTLKRSLSSSEIDHLRGVELAERLNERSRASLSALHESDQSTCWLCKKKVAVVGYYAHWCQSCESRRFEEKFGTWTSGNDDLDCFILETQLDAKSCFDYLEWIPYSRLCNIQYVGSGYFGSVFRSFWIDGPRDVWDVSTSQYRRREKYPVALKLLDNSQNISQEFLEGLKENLRSENNSGVHVIRFLGITQDPDTKNYVWVIQYARDGDLTKYLTKSPFSITWERKLEILYGIIIGLSRIHKKGLIHRNLHGGNVLINLNMASIGDLGMCRPAGKSDSFDDKDGSHGVLPFMAPEILRNKPHTTSADVYSFGFIMWQLATNRKPFAGKSHDSHLALEICKGLRPEITEDIPECYARLMRRCWEDDPSSRPSADELHETIGIWFAEVCDSMSTETSTEFRIAEERRKNMVKIRKRKGHCMIEQIDPGASYTSRHLTFDCLQNIYPEKVNDDPEKGKIDQKSAIIKYMTSETELYNLKAASIQADNTIEAAEIYDVIQYWPEKDHQLQLKALNRLLTNHPEFRDGLEKVRLVLIGSCRNEEDQARIQELRKLCERLNIEGNIEFEVNASFPVLVDWLSIAMIGLHTMWNEHFGIGIVEYMAAGAIPVAHNSGGPKMDIVVPYNNKITGIKYIIEGNIYN
ncbi:6016_t:CDS:2 [Acaulospora colombiana]|uniref:6016_t:CDS:1 n=1 Tax=Acaulospora colombiana TaxID=27376 RepID=A0ACA9L8X4_9GLOM|nr:6016_t:CDS:2 [Acaulospora colombiana]